MVKVDKKFAASIILICAILVVAIFIWFELSPRSFLPDSIKFEVSNLKIEPDTSWSNSKIYLTVTNTYNSPLTIVGYRLNGKSFGYSDFEVPPGQTRDGNLIINGLPITNSTSYDIKLTFTFEDGEYQDFAETIIPKTYAPGFMVIESSLNASSLDSAIYSVKLQNTGNIPMINAKITVNDSYQATLPLDRTLQPKDTATVNIEIPIPIKKGDNWTIELEATYAEGSTFSSQSSYNFK